MSLCNTLQHTATLHIYWDLTTCLIYMWRYVFIHMQFVRERECLNVWENIRIYLSRFYLSRHIMECTYGGNSFIHSFIHTWWEVRVSMCVSRWVTECLCVSERVRQSPWICRRMSAFRHTHILSQTSYINELRTPFINAYVNEWIPPCINEIRRGIIVDVGASTHLDTPIFSHRLHT